MEVGNALGWAMAELLGKSNSSLGHLKMHKERQ